MFGKQKILALIPARGGSKGIKDKNIIPLAGKPLIAYSIEAAKKSKYIDSIVVTTDSEKIAEVAKRYGARVPFLRPVELAADTSKTIDAVLHAIKTLKSMGENYDTLVLLQPTQPLRTTDDIGKAIELYYEDGENGLVSISPVDDSPLLIRSIGADGKLLNLLSQNSTCRRQDMPNYYKVNGCIYINKIDELNENTSFNDNRIPFIMDKEHSIDIDEMSDLWMAECYLKNNIC